MVAEGGAIVASSVTIMGFLCNKPVLVLVLGRLQIAELANLNLGNRVCLDISYLPVCSSAYLPLVSSPFFPTPVAAVAVLLPTVTNAREDM